MPSKLKIAAMVTAMAFLSSCVSDDVLGSATSTNQSPQIESAVATPAPAPIQAPAAAEPLASETTLAALPQDNSTPIGQATALEQTAPVLQDQVEVRTKGPNKTYLINGLLSAVPFIGYGFRNLKKKMPEAKLYSYLGVVEGPAAIAPAVVKDAEKSYRANPNTKINLVGISLGADLITVIAEKLAAKNVPVNYLGIVDGTNLRPIQSNVRKADNLTCTNLDCTKAKAKLARGNTTTIFREKKFVSSHIPLGDNDELHRLVIAQSRN